MIAKLVSVSDQLLFHRWTGAGNFKLKLVHMQWPSMSWTARSYNIGVTLPEVQVSMVIINFISYHFNIPVIFFTLISCSICTEYQIENNNLVMSCKFGNT